ncbi:MAG: flavodoxin [Anaerovoracaceae bacterium]
MLKKVIGLAMIAAMVVLLVACGQSSGENNKSAEKGTNEDGKTLVAYFSWSGNTKEMASYIAEQTGGDLYEITPAEDYPEDYNETGDVAKAERDENARPEIANLPDSIDEYDRILIGYPIWWHTAPMIIGTFLESYDLSGVDVYPFTQSASMDTEQFENSIDFVRENADGANIHDGMFVSSSDTEGIDAYLSENGLNK